MSEPIFSLYLAKCGYWVLRTVFGLLALASGLWGAVTLVGQVLHWLKTDVWKPFTALHLLDPFVVGDLSWVGLTRLLYSISGVGVLVAITFLALVLYAVFEVLLEGVELKLLDLKEQGRRK